MIKNLQKKKYINLSKRSEKMPYKLLTKIVSIDSTENNQEMPDNIVNIEKFKSNNSLNEKQKEDLQNHETSKNLVNEESQDNDIVIDNSLASLPVSECSISLEVGAIAPIISFLDNIRTLYRKCYKNNYIPYFAQVDYMFLKVINGVARISYNGTCRILFKIPIVINESKTIEDPIIVDIEGLIKILKNSDNSSIMKISKQDSYFKLDILKTLNGLPIEDSSDIFYSIGDCKSTLKFAEAISRFECYLRKKDKYKKLDKEKFIEFCNKANKMLDLYSKSSGKKFLIIENSKVYFQTGEYNNKAFIEFENTVIEDNLILSGNSLKIMNSLLCTLSKIKKHYKDKTNEDLLISYYREKNKKYICLSSEYFTSVIDVSDDTENKAEAIKSKLSSYSTEKKQNLPLERLISILKILTNYGINRGADENIKLYNKDKKLFLMAKTRYYQEINEQIAKNEDDIDCTYDKNIVAKFLLNTLDIFKSYCNDEEYDIYLNKDNNIILDGKEKIKILLL